MNQYKQAMDNIHAPEALVCIVRAKMHEANDKMQCDALTVQEEAEGERTKKPAIYRIPTFKIAGIAACLCLIVFGMCYQISRKNIIPELSSCVDSESYAESYKAASSTISQLEISDSEYSKKTGRAASNILAGFELGDCKFVAVSGGADSVTDYIARLDYFNGETSYVLTISENQILAPLALLNTDPRKINDVSVHLGKSAENNTIYAAWSIENGFVYIKSTTMSEHEFIVTLMKLFAELE